MTTTILLDAVERLPGREAEAAVLSPNAEALAILDDLSRPLEERLYGPISAAGHDAPPPVLTQYPRPLDVRHTDRNTTLTAASWDLDPMLNQDHGRLRAPRSEKRKLKKFKRRGLDPELVWVLREFPGTWKPGEEPPRMIDLKTAETARTRHAQHLQVGAAAFVVGRALLYTAAAGFALAAGAAVSLGALTVAGIGAVATAPLAKGLDPIVLGGVVDPKTGSVAWVPLAAWDEIPDERSW